MLSLNLYITSNAETHFQTCKNRAVALFVAVRGHLRILPYLQVHKGNLTALKENQCEIKVEQQQLNSRQSKALVITTPKGFSKVQSNTNENDDNIENEAEKIDDSKKFETEEEKTKMQNGGQTVPPKPLPRASRTNSISEEEPKPVARPRTSPNPGSVVTSVNPNAIGGYKVVISLEKKSILMLYKELSEVRDNA